MALNSLGYIILFPAMLILYYALSDKWRVYLLTLASIALYSLWGFSFVCILFLVTAFTYFSAGMVSRNMENKAVCKTVLAVNVLFVAGILVFFRFSPAGSIIVPIGISFYSIQALGYVADVYNGRSKAERNFLKYLLFISFFPTVTSGPIQRSEVLLDQINEEKELNYERIRSGLLMIAYGLFAKSFVADRLGYLVSQAYEGYETETGFVLLIGVVIYAFQLYCDFMGYSYIALGSAKSLGFELPDNFKQPYFSGSVKEFWGRWHISLSTWLRDYIYFPLGGSRKGLARSVINIAVVFLISGIWHGRGLTFIVWGGLHGLYRIIEVLTLKKRGEAIGKSKNTGIRKLLVFFSVIRTFILVDFAWLFFRAETLGSALTIIRRIITENEMIRSIRDGLYTFGLAKKEIAIWFLGLLIVFIVDLLHEKGIRIGEWLKKQNVIFRWTVYVLYACFMLGSMIYYYGYSSSTFIYSGF